MEYSKICYKKSGKWRLLEDLRVTNDTMESMGALQSGLPSPVTIPKGSHIIVKDLQYLFFYYSISSTGL